MSKQLVCQYLENISRDALESYQHLINGYIKHRHGIYALYRKNKLYYVGLASNLRNRLNHHLKDRHSDSWDRFSIYLVIKDEHMKELESLLLRIFMPKGNKQKGKFKRAENIKRRFRKDMSQFQRLQLKNVLGEPAKNIQKEIADQGRVPIMKKYVKRKGFQIRMDYKGKRYNARVKSNGQICFKGKFFNSPSLAAVSVLKRAANGWYWWKYQRSPGEWVRIDEMRG